MTDLDGFAHVTLQVALLVHDFHGAAAQNIARTHHQRVTEGGSFFKRLGLGTGRRVGRLAQLELVQELLKAFTVFGRVDHVGRGADDGHAVALQVQRQLQRRLATVLHDHAERLFFVNDLEHVFQRQRLEVQAVGGIVVGGHGFGVAVDHDGLVTVFAHGQCRVNAAVVKLDALADAVGAAAQHHDLFLVGRCGFAFAAFGLVGRVHVGGVGGELGRAGVDPFVNRAHTESLALVADGGVSGFELTRQPAV